MKSFIFILLLCVCESILLQNEVSFRNGTLIGTVNDSRKKKLNGCGTSRTHPGILYAQNANHHYGSVIYAIDTRTAQMVGSITLSGVQILNEWSDMAVGPCANSAGSCIYVGDIGSDKGHAPANKIYMLREPSSVNGDRQVPPDGVLTFKYNGNGSKALMVDNVGEMYVISLAHAGEHSKFYHIPKSGWSSTQTVNVNNGVYIGITSQNKDPVGGDISPNGEDILVKMQEKIYMWKRNGNISGSYNAVFDRSPAVVPYIYVRQDEAVCWAHDGSGYYTIPEGDNPPLHFYARN